MKDLGFRETFLRRSLKEEEVLQEESINSDRIMKEKAIEIELGRILGMIAMLVEVEMSKISDILTVSIRCIMIK
jgi:hypothetical protein